MKIVYDFIEGRIDYKEFFSQLQSDNRIYDWLQSIYREEMLEDKSFPCETVLWYSNGNVKKAFAGMLGHGLYSISSIQEFLSNYLSYVFPDRKIEYYDEYDKLYSLSLDIVCDCYGGPEVEDLIMDVIRSLPEDLSKTKKIKLGKAKMRELFPGKRPYWIELPEWPVCNGRPMEYVSKKVDGDLFVYKFRDAKTGEERMVKQFA